MGNLSSSDNLQPGTLDLSSSSVQLFANQPANYVYAGPTSGAPAQPAFRPLVYADITVDPATLKIANFTFADTERLELVDTSAGIITGTLPTAVGRRGKIFGIKKISGDNNNFVFATTGGQTIDNYGSGLLIVASPQSVVWLVSDNANWRILDYQINDFAHIYKAAAQAIPTGVITQILFNTQVWNDGGIVGASLISPKVAAFYNVIARCQWEPSALGIRDLAIVVAGTIVARTTQVPIAANSIIQETVWTGRVLNGNSITAEVVQNSGVNQNVENQLNFNPSLIVRLDRLLIS